VSETSPGERAAPVLSETALADLARARGWALLVGVACAVALVLLAIATMIASVSSTRDASRAFNLGYLVGRLGILVVPAAPAVLMLLYAHNLRRFARGERPALAAAFRALRALLAIGAVGYGLLLLVALWALRS
jgi:hypothetical protein